VNGLSMAVRRSRPSNPTCPKYELTRRPVRADHPRAGPLRAASTCRGLDGLGITGYLAQGVGLVRVSSHHGAVLPVDSPTKPFGLKVASRQRTGYPRPPTRWRHHRSRPVCPKCCGALGYRWPLASHPCCWVPRRRSSRLIAGFYQAASTRVVSVFNTLLAIPQVVLALTFVAVFAPSEGSTSRRFQALDRHHHRPGIVSIPILARITVQHARVVTTRVASRRAVGAKNRRIIVREYCERDARDVLDRVLGVAVVIVAEGGLAILASVQTSDAVLGEHHRRGLTPASFHVWPILAPSIAIFLTVLSLKLSGDVVRARFDVRESAI